MLCLDTQPEMLSVAVAAVVEKRLRSANLFSENGPNTFFVELQSILALTVLVSSTKRDYMTLSQIKKFYSRCGNEE